MLKRIIRSCCGNDIMRSLGQSHNWVSESNEILLEGDILNYNLGRLLGEGKFGRVYLGLNRVRHKYYAIKKSVKMNSLFSNELKFLRKLYHRSLIKLEESFIYEGHHYLVLDYYKDGDMFTYIKKHHEFDEDNTRKIILNILRPLLFLKQYKIAHLDIKPENYLLRDIKSLDFVLTDFGTMREYKEYNIEYKLNSIVGTKIYAAPEILNKRYSSKSDIWSLGQIILILVSGKLIEYEENYTQLDIYDLIRGLKVDRNSYNLVRKCLTINSSNRISLEEIIDDKWIEDYYLSVSR
jgi:calcium-dependent protein kinase